MDALRSIQRYGKPAVVLVNGNCESGQRYHLRVDAALKPGVHKQRVIQRYVSLRTLDPDEAAERGLVLAAALTEGKTLDELKKLATQWDAQSPYSSKIERNRAQRARKRARQKARGESQGRRRNGFTVAVVSWLREYQGLACAICRVKLTLEGLSRECADHCHATGKPRGLLCVACNTALGLYEKAQRHLGIDVYERYLSEYPMTRCVNPKSES